LKCLIYSIA